MVQEAVLIKAGAQICSPDTHLTTGIMLAGLLAYEQAWKISPSRANFLDTVYLPLPRESQLDIIQNMLK